MRRGRDAPTSSAATCSRCSTRRSWRRSRRTHGSRVSSRRPTPTTSRSISTRPTASASARCSTSRVRSTTSCLDRRVRRAEDLRRVGPAHLHPAAARHAVRGRPALLPDRRDGGRAQASADRDHRAQRQGARQARLRRCPAEHHGQDAGVRLQRARQRLCRRLDAAHLGRSGRGRRAARTSRCAPCRSGLRHSATCGRRCARREASI